MHQFDARDDKDPNGRPWLPGAGGNEKDRISVSLVNAAMQPDPGGNIPMYSFDLGGIIISPWKARLLCSYPFDVGTVSRKKCSDPNPGMQHCIPGCTPNDWRANGGSEWGSRGIWCPPVDHTASWESQAERFEAIQFSGQPCAWKPEHHPSLLPLAATYTHAHTQAAGQADN